jgi:hypothetical protein
LGRSGQTVAVTDEEFDDDDEEFSEEDFEDVDGEPRPRWTPKRGGGALGAAMLGLGQLLEGKPEREHQVAEADDSGDDGGLRFSFDPDDPRSAVIHVERD